MSIGLANLIVSAFGIYVSVGIIFALIFILFGASKIDPAAKGMPLQARLIIFPGVAGLWPLMLVKLFNQKSPPLS